MSLCKTTRSEQVALAAGPIERCKVAAGQLEQVVGDLPGALRRGRLMPRIGDVGKCSVGHGVLLELCCALLARNDFRNPEALVLDAVLDQLDPPDQVAVYSPTRDAGGGDRRDELRSDRQVAY